MKTKILFSLAILFSIASTANAQISEGKYLLGGNVYFTHQNSTFENGDENIENNNVGIGIQLGKFITSTSAIGGILQFSHADASLNKSNSYGIGVFYRKYKPLGSNFYLFGEGNIQYSYFKAENKNNSNYSTSNGVGLNLLPGISYSITPKIQMELTIPNLLYVSYSSSKTPDSSPSKQSSFSIGGSLNQNTLSNIGLGFKLIL